MGTRISKANRAIVRNTVERWLNTLTVGTPDVEKSKVCLRAAYESGMGCYRGDRYKKMDVAFHVVQSPIAFMIATSVARGRMGKRVAQQLCHEIGIERSFLGNIRKDSLLKWNPDRDNFWRTPNTELTRTWLRAIREEYLSNEQLVASVTGVQRRWWRRSVQRPDREDLQQSYRVNALNLVMPMLHSMIIDAMGLDTVREQQTTWDRRQINVDVRKADNKHREIVDRAIWDSNTTMSAVGELQRAIDMRDLVRPEANQSLDGTVFLGAIPKAVDAEILCRILKIDAPEMTWEHEVFHHCTAFAAFQQSCIILAARPEIAVNDEGNIHHARGPAVSWADGTALWFNDGHFMNEGGKTIVMQPEKLSTNYILNIRNEETRRLAIEKFGWDRFIAEANCQIIDRRVNEVDNTIEMLVGPPANEAQTSRVNRMVLFCRSTGRRYFIGVPRNIASCVDAQKWMSDSGASESIAYAARPLNIVGAS